jgi:Superinfection immunity protein
MILFIAVMVGLISYFLPTLVASGKGRKNTTAIGVFNLFFGWTFLGWVAALVWALTEGK